MYMCIMIAKKRKKVPKKAPSCRSQDLLLPILILVFVLFILVLSFFQNQGMGKIDMKRKEKRTSMFSYLRTTLHSSSPHTLFSNWGRLQLVGKFQSAVDEFSVFFFLGAFARAR